MNLPRLPTWALRLLPVLLAVLCSPAQAGLPRLCSPPDLYTPAEKDRAFRFSAVVKRTLEASGHRVALIARSGLDLKRFQQRYSHAGITLRDSANAPWSVRQLYYACDDEAPRIFDQGISGFVLGSDQPSVGYLSLLFLPPAPAEALARTALDKRQALQLLHSRYSANAHAFGVRYQNCNQWVAELLALAWGGIARAEEPAEPAEPAATGEPSAAGETSDRAASPHSIEQRRRAAQQWLKSEGYTPTVMAVGWRPLMWLATALPWLHNDDHPAADLQQGLYRVSMPAAIEDFVRRRWPQAERIELCHNTHQVVLRRGWQPIAEGCEAGPEDTVFPLD